MLTDAWSEAETMRRKAASMAKRELPAAPVVAARRLRSSSACLLSSACRARHESSIEPMTDNERECWREAVVVLRRLVDKLEDQLVKVDPNMLRNASKELERKYGESEQQRVQLRMELNSQQSLLRALQEMGAARASTCVGMGTERNRV